MQNNKYTRYALITKMPQRAKSINNKDNNKNKTKRGSLIIVGSGIQAVRHITFEARQAIENSDKVIYFVVDPITQIWIKKLRPDAESLQKYYVESEDRRTQIYSKMVEHTMKYVRQGYSTCMVLYGHPGVFTNLFTQPAIKMARKEGFRTHMQPGISAEDFLFAELCVDPGDSGCQSFEATRFLLQRRKFDTFCHLILWQIGIIGQRGYRFRIKNPKPGIAVLADYLKKFYDSNHEVYVYQAAPYSICEPLIQRIPLYKLPEAYVDAISTLYVPPIATGGGATIDKKIAQRLGLAERLGISSKH